MKQVSAMVLLGGILTGCAAYTISSKELGDGSSQIEVRMRVREARSTLSYACKVDGGEIHVDAGVISATAPTIVTQVPPGPFVITLSPTKGEVLSIAVRVEAGWKTIIDLEQPVSDRWLSKWLLSNEGSAGERALKAAMRFVFGVAVFFLWAL